MALIAMVLISYEAKSELNNWSGEFGAGILNLHGGFYKTIDSNSLVGVRSFIGFAPPMAYWQTAALYKYYFNDYLSSEEHFRGSFFGTAGINVMRTINLETRPNDDKPKWATDAFANLGVGYEFRMGDIFIQPNINFAIPLTKVDATMSYWENMKGVSLFTTMLTSIYIGLKL